MSILMLTGCVESREDEMEIKSKEFWAYAYKNADEQSRRNALYDKCFEKNVRNLLEIRDEAQRISGSNNKTSIEYFEAFRPLEKERNAALAKCNKIRSRK